MLSQHLVIVKTRNQQSMSNQQLSYSKRKRLTELGAIIKGISYPSLEPIFQTKGASEIARKPGPIEREVKLRELGKIIRG